MCASYCDSLTEEMHTYGKQEFRTICPQHKEDIGRFYALTIGLLDRVKFLEARPDSLREEISALRLEVKYLSKNRSTLAEEMQMRFYRVARRLEKLEKTSSP